ncbi:hypothetical protein FJV41_31265 [Myxococcus llanfairpwllgwyngyllgogerychwyrndrobwllllantysiliogogogochensis]|uniref:Uncharacterized protein n=1 Tax=Myxococcus llanfairpwllgwyngyllgogerychwyrndrobwllllantysiliogogogochensis TaxID=2590453 RepID=A0A540WSK2_9BACT|nr:hypothetical protein [Myxococcus llanfairpwllgwyngyllgogerychwyrndrobwllllantysiliogogogochensis]TQF12008.1 hypothetical protein FJV41_31265 [Myxococcus llanfairpwllgwyngyllgogerychwyrndrobwllllantysiliogogogochensis]
MSPGVTVGIIVFLVLPLLMTRIARGQNKVWHYAVLGIAGHSYAQWLPRGDPPLAAQVERFTDDHLMPFVYSFITPEVLIPVHATILILGFVAVMVRVRRGY